MTAGTTFKQCGCRDTSTGKPLGRKCPKLRRGNGWSPVHGTWYYQLELPPRADGTRHGGFTTQTGAAAELSLAHELLALAPLGDPGTAIRIADAITATFKATGTLPDLDRVRNLLRAAVVVDLRDQAPGLGRVDDADGLVEVEGEPFLR
jgi:hypothetical protein